MPEFVTKLAVKGVDPHGLDPRSLEADEIIGDGITAAA